MALNSLTQKATSFVGNKTNSLLGLNSNDIPLIDSFYNSILTDAHNTLPEASNWVGFFTMNIPKDVEEKALPRLRDRISGAIKSIPGLVENALLGSPAATANDLAKAVIEPLNSDLEPHKWTLHGDENKAFKMAERFLTGTGMSVMFIAGVDLPEDGFSVMRPTSEYNVGGFTKGIVTNPRDDFATLRVTFLETNSSLVDFVIRPWMIHSSYASLKYAYNATFTMYNLVRSPSGFRIRKRLDFYNVVPLKIDGNQYIYSAQTDFAKRQTEFVFRDYTISEGEGLEDGLIGNVVNFAKRTLSGAITGAIGAGVDLVAGSADRVYTNVYGQLVDTVRGAITDTQTSLREYSKKAEESLTSELNLESGRRVQLPLPVKDSQVRGGANYDIKDVDTNDTPDLGSLNYQHVSINSNDNIGD